MSAKVARGMIRGWTSRKHKEHWQSTCGQRLAKGFLKRPWEITHLEQKPAMIYDQVVSRTLSLKRIFKLGLVNGPECDRCKQASEMALHVLWDCEALATWSTFYETRWLWKCLHQQDTDLYWRCRAAKCIHQGLHKSLKMKCMGHHGASPSVV